MFSIVFLLTVCLVPLVTSSNIECGENNFPCDTGNQCVERKKWCDKILDCDDNSDEAYCSLSKWYTSFDPNDCFEKNETYIFCNSGVCFPLVAKCDGYEDCKDGDDEENCKSTTTQTESSLSSSSVKPNGSLDKDNSRSKEINSVSTISAYETSQSTPVINLHNEDRQVQTTTTTRVTYPSRNNDHWPTSTDYYDKRLKEANFDVKTKAPSLTFPKEIPTRAYKSTQKIITSNFVKPTTPAAPRSVPSIHPPIHSPLSQNTYPPRQFDQQRHTINQRTNHYQPPINHYQFPSNRYHTPPNHYQTPSSHRYHHPPTSNHQPTPNSYQPSYNHYQPTPNSYHPSYNHYQPTSNSHRPSYNHYQPPSNSHRPSYNHYQPPSNSHRPSYNHYQPSTNSHQSSSNSHQSSSNHHQPPNNHQPHRSSSNTNNNGHRSLNGQSGNGYQANYFKPYSPKLELKRPFYFAKDYGSLYGRDNARSISDGVEWILRQRSDSGDWDRDTPRAVVALALSSNNSFFNGDNDGEIIKRRFMVQLGTDLLRNNTINFNINRMFMAINGLLAVCEDPTDFHGIDLAEQLRHKIENSKENNNKQRSYLNPFLSLSLCLSNKSLTSSEIHALMHQMTSAIRTERNKDTLIAAIMAFSCYVHQHSAEDSNYSRSLRSRLLDAVAKLLEYVGDDGGFGSVYSTALAAQALMSTNESYHWNANKTMNFLKQQQRQDGSFGGFLATYWALPALSGKSLLHLRNIDCNPVKRELTPKEILEFAGPKQYVHYSLYFRYPLDNSQSEFLPLPQGINFMDVMRVAEYQNPSFRFTLENNSSKVYSLSGLPNDSELGLSWHLYVRQESSSHLHEPNSREKFTGDLRSLSPKPGEIFIFWYHSNDL